MTTPPMSGDSAELLQLADHICNRWRDLRVHGGFVARNIDTGRQLCVDPDRPWPLASVAKVPLALVVADRIAQGELAGGTMVTLEPAERSHGPTGLSAFRHPATCAIDDLLLQMITVSDNAAADALFELVPPPEVTSRLRQWGVDAIHVRHPMQLMYEAATRVAGPDFTLGRRLAVEGARPRGGHVIDSLDVHRATVGSAAALVDLLCRIWTGDIAEPAATATVREAMSRQVTSPRIGADLQADDIRIAGKTGSFLTLRHEIGVVEYGTSRVAVAALTTSERTARIQHDVDLAIGAAVRDAVEALA
ncbi:beta-lactamase class A [Prauserella sediminis]|uniref:Beta-lactamase class A n=1 Tax=Prauserella sediminis TaxID=577680 RepID=A0A839XUH0_9PSEU|nr:serine hydrolase [Prauserella sediminis]MBB3665679.1 beta-lactamase class A [Prauserella sediminis]